MSALSNLFKYFQALSLDIALGGVVGSMFISSYLGVQVDIMTYAILGLSIWLIYTLDHLLDTQNVVQTPITFRHQFHWNNYTTLWGIWSFCLIMVLSMLYKLPTPTLIAGVIAGAFVVGYFVSIKFLLTGKVYHKEITAAVIYSLGLFIPSISIMDKPVGLDVWLLFVELFAVALTNLLIFSIFERSIDKEEGFHSLVIAMNVKSVKSITWGMIAAVYTIIIVGLVMIPTEKYIITQLIIGVMNTCLALILYKGDLFVINTRYRSFADAVFIFPGVYLLINHVI